MTTLTHREKCELIELFGLHCSIKQFDELAEVIGKRAVAERALEVMAENAAELGLDYAVEMRILGEEK